MKWYISYRNYVYNILKTIIIVLPIVLMLGTTFVIDKYLLYDSKFISLVVLTSISYFVSVMWYSGLNLDYRIGLELEDFVLLLRITLVRNNKTVKNVLYSIIIIILIVPILIGLLIIKILMEI